MAKIKQSIKSAKAAKKKSQPKRKTPARSSAGKPPKRAQPARAPRHGAARKLPPAGVNKVKEPAAIATSRSDAVVPPAPSRPPMRKIIGADRKVITLPTVKSTNGAQAVTSGDNAASSNLASLPTPTAAPAPIQVRDVTSAPLLAHPVEAPSKVSWNALPACLPSSLRFLMNAIRREALEAAAWPFPYAQFISTLPNEMCGLEFALLLLSLEFDAAESALHCGMEEAHVEILLERGRTHLEELFSARCGNMARRFRTQIGKPDLAIGSLVEQFLLANVDRDFQTLLATLLLSSMGSHTVVREHRAHPQLHAG
ncbi:MAG: hypothetical protein QY326_07305 [Bdellovibrionota bacterium]|nr:MAG: hypothetical protein QY326_07305 [Bdellovibrionota bacterium]